MTSTLVPKLGTNTPRPAYWNSTVRIISCAGRNVTQSSSPSRQVKVFACSKRCSPSSFDIRCGVSVNAYSVRRQLSNESPPGPAAYRRRGVMSRPRSRP